MYTSYFGFREKPFNVTPDPRFVYMNPAFREAYASLLAGIRERKGFVVLTGEVGTGKTTLLRVLMKNLEATVRFVYFYNTTLSFEELLTYACEELGLETNGGGRLKKIQALNDFLIEQLRKGGTGALLIDEAQHLSEHVLENLRLLSNLETGTEKLLQIILVGQPELEAKLAQPSLRQFKQRVSVQCRIDRLKDREIMPYVQFRLESVGSPRKDIFSKAAIERVAHYSNGIPRLINIICDNALTIAFATHRRGGRRRSPPQGACSRRARALPDTQRGAGARTRGGADPGGRIRTRSPPRRSRRRILGHPAATRRAAWEAGRGDHRGGAGGDRGGHGGTRVRAAADGRWDERARRPWLRDERCRQHGDAGLEWSDVPGDGRRHAPLPAGNECAVAGRHGDPEGGECAGPRRGGADRARAGRSGIIGTHGEAGPRPADVTQGVAGATGAGADRDGRVPGGEPSARACRPSRDANGGSDGDTDAHAGTGGGAAQPAGRPAADGHPARRHDLRYRVQELRAVQYSGRRSHQGVQPPHRGSRLDPDRRSTVATPADARDTHPPAARWLVSRDPRLVPQPRGGREAHRRDPSARS
jgi:type II secretory pathway predicted ATPase ExeA